MAPPVEVVKHDLNNEPCFPERVVDVLRTLGRPLPRTLAKQSELLPTLPPGLHPLYQETLESEDLVLEEDDDLDPPCRPVSDILGSVLTSVLTARSTRQCHHGRSERQRCWTSLLLACRAAMLESSEVFISEDVAFALPRTVSTLAQLQIEKFEGTAVAMLSVRTERAVHVPPEHTSSTVEATADEICEQLTSTHDSTHDSAHDFWAENDAEPVASSTSGDSVYSYTSFRVSFDAHISPGRGRRVDCELPVICTADENEIQDLVIAVVCQRHVWGVATPVVGISLPQSGTYASVVVGWLEVNKTDSSGSAPVVHLASHWGVPPSTLPPGVFDVSDPTSALRFAQFILGLHLQFSSIKESTRTAEPREFCWRLDHGGFDELLFNSDDSCLADYRVQAWVAEQASTNELVSSVPPDCRPSSSPPMSSQSRRTRSSATSPQSPDGYLAPPANDHAAKPPKDQDAASRIYSASSFANLRPTRPFKHGLRLWMMERFSMMIVNIKIETPKSGLENQINDMVEKYDEMTRFEWPEEWKTLSSLPKCDAAHESLRKQLFQDFKEFEVSQVAPIRKVSSSSSFVQSICGRVSTFLTAVAGAMTSKINEDEGVITECASRSAWDTILRAACCAPGEMLAETFYVEQNIRLAGNRAIYEKDHTKATRFAEEMVLITSYQVSATFANRYTLPSAVPGVARVESNYAAEYVQCLQDRINPPSPGNRNYEPWQAITDGVVCLRFPFDESPNRTALTTHQSGNAEIWAAKVLGGFKKFFKVKQLNESTTAAGCTVATQGLAPNPEQAPVPSDNEPPNPHASCLMCSHVTSALFNLHPASPAARKSQIFVPFIFVEYKRSSMPLLKASNQMKMYCITGVEFLASIGVKDWPVWGIFTSGSEGLITMAWKSSKSAERSTGSASKRPGQAELTDVNVFMLHNLKRFNLVRPLEAYHFYTCVHRLYQSRTDLEVRLKASNVAERLRDPNFESWMMPIPPPRDEKKSGNESSKEAS